MLGLTAAAEIDEPSTRQDRIADRMWVDYLAVCCERENEGYSSDHDDRESKDCDEASGDGNE